MNFTITDAKRLRRKHRTFVAFLRVDGWKVARLEGHMIYKDWMNRRGEMEESFCIVTGSPGFRSPLDMWYYVQQQDLLSMVHRKLEEQEAPVREWRFDKALDRARRRRTA